MVGTAVAGGAQIGLRDVPYVEADIDAWSDDMPEGYRRVREAGAVCRRNGDSRYLIGRYADVKQAIADWENFSAEGEKMNSLLDQVLANTVLTTDPPNHGRLKSVLMRPIAPNRIKAMRATIEAAAEALAEQASDSGEIDIVTDFSPILPMSIVRDLVGLPDEGREQMAGWGNAVFDAFIADRDEDHPLMHHARPIVEGMMLFLSDPSLPGRLKAGGWASELYEAVEAGEISNELFQTMVTGYILPAIDTTLNATSSLIYLFAQHPDQWALLRERPELINQAINEGLRLESPSQVVIRRAARDIALGAHVVPKDASVGLLIGAANRDERRFPDAERFDITRDAKGHMGFGFSTHVCAGMNVAKAELAALISALAKRVERIEVVNAVRLEFSPFRGFSKLVVRLHKH